MIDKPWMWSVFSKEEIDELTKNTHRIVWDQENGLVIHLTLTNNQCMEFLHHYFISRDLESPDSLESNMFIQGFLHDLMAQLEQHLEQEAPNWQERFYGLDSDDDESSS